jgi:hypothetical protein
VTLDKIEQRESQAPPCLRSQMHVVRKRESVACRSVPQIALWKDADPDIPILKQAKAEYAKSQ